MKNINQKPRREKRRSTTIGSAIEKASLLAIKPTGGIKTHKPSKCALATLLVIASCTGLCDKGTINMNLADFDEKDWVQVRESRFPTAGTFIKEKGGITNFIPENSSAKDQYHVKNGISFALRLLKNFEALDGYIELELELEGTAAPSIYFRTQTENGVHKETYNLVIFNHTKVNPGYQGINLYKWKSKWAHTGKPGWKRMATWIFPVPLNKKIKLAVEFKKAEITIFFNDKTKGHFFDSDPLPAGKAGICAIEGKNYFYNFKISDKKQKHK